ncbi:MAG: PAS domain S-box protein [Candidatus Sumerlaeota bacterium]|nr:PAS domain S-box protein [Candidatus Sumerlaeota bacterium]
MDEPQNPSESSPMEQSTHKSESPPSKDKNTQETLRQKEQMLQVKANQTHSILWTTDLNLRFTSIAGKLLDTFNIKPEKLIGQSIQEYFKTHDPDNTFLKVHMNALKGTAGHYTTHYKNRVFENYIEPLRDESGIIIGTSGIALDITERVQIEQDLKVKQWGMDSSINAVAIMTLEGKITYVNPSFRILWDYDDAGNIIGKPFSSFWQKPDEARTVMESLRKEGRWQGEMTALRKDRSSFDAQVAASMVKDDAGNPICMMASTVDITGHNLLEKALSIAKFSIDHSADAIVWIDPDGRYLYINDAACRITGYTREEILNKTIFDFAKDYSKQKWKTFWANLKQKGSLVTETILKIKGGGTVIVENTCNYVHYKGSEFNCIFARNITERRHIEDELKKVHDIYHSTIRSSNGVAYSLRFSDMSYDYFDEDGEALLGIPVRNLKQHDFNQLVKERIIIEPEDISGLSFRQEKVGRYVANYRIVTPKGEEKWLSDFSSPVRDEKTGEVTGSMGILFDITKQKRTEMEHAALQEISEDLASLVSLKEMGAMLAARSRNLLRYDAFNFSLYDESHNIFTKVYLEDTPVGGGEPITVVPNKSMQLSKHNPLYPDFTPKLINRKRKKTGAKLARFGFKERISRSLMFAPVMWEKRLLGVISAQSYTQDFYKEQDLKLLHAIAELCGGAVARMRSCESLTAKDRAIESSINAVVMADLSGMVNYVNPSFQRLWDYDDPQDVIGKPLSRLFQSTGESKKIIDILREQDGWLGEMTAVRQDGSTFDALVSASIVRDKSGSPFSMMASVTDLTGHNLLKRALSIAMLSIERSGEAIVWVEPDGHHIYANDAACNLTGYSRDELLSLSVKDLNPKYNWQKWKKDWEQTKKEQNRIIETTLRTRDGRDVQMETSVNYINYRGKEFHCSFIRDITKRKLAEEELKKAHDIYRKAIHNSMGVVYSLRFPDWRYEYFDKEGESMLGASFAGRTSGDFNKLVRETIIIDPDAPKDVHDYSAAFRRGEVKHYNVDYRIITPQGVEKWLRDCAVPIISEQTGKVTGSLGILYDITEYKRTEMEKETLQHISERISSLIDLGEIATLLAEESRSLFKHDAFWFGLYDESNNTLTRIHMEDTPKGASHPEKMGQAQVTKLDRRTTVFPTRQPRLINRNVEPKKSKLTPFGATDRLSRSLMFAPVLWENRLIGGISVHSYTPKRYTDRDLKLLHAMAEQCAGVVSRLRAIESLRVKDWAIDSSINAIAILNLDGRVTYANHSFLSLWEYDDISEAKGKSFSSLWVHKSSAQKVWDAIRKEGDWKGELEARRGDGASFEALVSASTVIDASGNPICIMFSFMDITKHKLADKALHLSRFCMDSAGDIILWFDADSNFFYANEAASRILGYSADELLSMKISDIDAVLTKETHRERWKLMEKQGAITFESIHTTKDGRQIPVDINVTYLQYGGKKFGCAFIRDISERRAAETKIREEERKYRMVVENAEALITIINNDGVILMVNNALALILGGKPQDIAGKTMWDFLPRETADNHMTNIRKVIKSGRALNMPHHPSVIGGHEHWFRTNIQPIPDSSGKVSCAQVMAHDITDLKHAGKNMKDTNERLQYLEGLNQALLLSTPHGICMLNSEWKIEWANDTAREILDPESALPSLTNIPFKKFFPTGGDFDKYKSSARDTIRKKGVDRRDIYLKTPKGARFRCNISLVRIDQSGTHRKFIASISPIK